MRRREFIAGLGGAVAWPMVAQAHEMPRIAVLLNFTEKAGEPLLSVLLREFRQLGWVDGETAHIDIRWGAGDAARIRKGITELLALAPDVIVTTSTPPTSMFREATRTIPIIFGSMSIPSGQESSRLYRTPVAMLRDLQTTNTASVRNGSSC
jgi:putative ABC transport system substrate-binding protein